MYAKNSGAFPTICMWLRIKIGEPQGPVVNNSWIGLSVHFAYLAMDYEAEAD
jgi:hypothetical protein